MTDTIQNIKRYFALPELVGRDVADKYGELAWAFLDSRLLDVILWLREGLNIPLVCNTPALQQRGLRTNLSPIVQEKTKACKMYLSAHCLGKGVDLSSSKMSANDMRKWIRQHIDECPHPIRLEGDKSAPTWMHVDVMNITDNKLVIFEV